MPYEFDYDKFVASRLEKYSLDPIKDKDGNPLTPEECWDYECDLWDMGIPMSSSGACWLWQKWGERLGIQKPAGYQEWLDACKEKA